MSLRPPKDLVALCGSSTRVRTLAVLASAVEPMTGYRIGREGGVPFPKLYPELERLRRAGLVSKRESGWALAVPAVRQLFRRRFPLPLPHGWSTEVERRRAEDEAILSLLRAMPAPRFRRGGANRNLPRVSRDPEKDRLLRRLGLGTSLHG